jgi:hypothetical protein
LARIGKSFLASELDRALAALSRVDLPTSSSPTRPLEIRLAKGRALDIPPKKGGIWKPNAREIQGIPKSLHETNGTAPRLPVRGRNAGPAADRTKHRAHEYLQNIPDQGRIVREAIAQRKGERQHPPPNGHFGKNTIHEMGCGVSHATATARRAETSLA